jgi:UDP-N-acetylmuramoylalanine--D-glutamate ligase
VVGLGRSGLAAARLARARGARVLVVDRRPEEELGGLPTRARDLGAEVQAGGHPTGLVAEADLIVVSPGVPKEIPLLEAAREIALPVWGEVELAARFCQGRVIGITGSNGKSTVTTMAGGILRGAGIPGGTGGNLATPFCDLLESDEPDAVHALELSSFQLESVEALRPRVSAILNLSPDHLDRHSSYEEYARAKALLLELQQADDFTLINADAPESDRFQGYVRGRLHRFSTRGELDRGAFLRRGRLTLRTNEGTQTLLAASELPVPGEHNVANALAAALCCSLVGCPGEAIDRGLRDYRPLPHRLEHVGSVSGVEFYNDSKATNPASTARALGSFSPGSVHLILGGQDKGADWSTLIDLLRVHARCVLLVGEAAEALRAELAETAPLITCETIPRAVREGFEGAMPGDVVLLSPGCASFDQYRNFEERGEEFRRAVERLDERGGADA